MDPIDRRILDELDRDCRISYKKLAGRIGISTTAVIRRVSSLIENGLKFIVLPSQAMISASGFLGIIHTDGTENVKEIINLIGSNRGVTTVSELVTTIGRAYFVTGSYIGSKRLLEIGRLFRGLNGAKDVELHSAIRSRISEGTKMTATKQQLLVLRALRKNARMQKKEIAEDSGLSVKRVRKTIREIQESGAFRFTTRWSHSFVKGIDLALRIQIDENATPSQQVWEWLKEEFPTRVFDVFQSATEPVLFAWFEPDDMREAHSICEIVRTESSVTSVTPLVFFSHKKFPWLGEFLLDEMIQAISDVRKAS
ncbi:MAG: winged helix-turn-helix transcriptional regulator [Candidatus Thorarchaeota archaeon]